MKYAMTRTRASGLGLAAALACAIIAPFHGAVPALARPTIHVKPVNRSRRLVNPPTTKTYSAATQARIVAEEAAGAQARRIRRPVAVPSLTTPTSMTLAHPNGSFTTTFHVLPVRVRSGNGWAPVNAALRRTASGAWSPKATPSGLSLSSGGASPLITMTSPAGGKLAIAVPWRLPAPKVSGATADYRGVLPGSDLYVTATSLGGVVITLETRSVASEKLAVSRLSSVLRTRALAVAVKDGEIRASAPSGLLEFSGQDPITWTGPAADSPGAVPVTAAGSERLPATVSGHRLAFANPGHWPAASADKPGRITWTVSPDTFSATTDTTRSANSNFDGTQEGCANANNYNTAFGPPNGNGPNGVPIGYQFWAGGCNGPDHAYFNLDISNLDDLGRGSSLANTTWNNQPALTNAEYLGSDHVTPTNPNCPTKQEADFDVTSSIQNAVAANPIWQSWNFGFDGDETFVSGQGNPNTPCWPSSSQNCGYLGIGPNPDVIVRFDLLPNVPASTREDPAPANNPDAANPDYGCAHAAPYGWINNPEPNLVATLTSNISNENVGAWFTINDDNATSSNQWSFPTNGYIQSGKSTDTSVGRNLLNGHQYTWSAVAQVSDSGQDSQPSNYESAPSANCTFNVDNAAPTGLSVSSTAFPASGSGMSGQDAGTSGTFNFHASDPVPANGCSPSPCLSSGVWKFFYSLNNSNINSGSSSVTASTNSNGIAMATKNLQIDDWGTNVLWVAAEDNAGNMSQPIPYTFYAPWNPNQKVTAGDVDGDGIPDLLGTTNGILDLFPGNVDPDATPGTASPADGTPISGVAWSNFQITHRGSFSQSGVDDLFAHASGGNAMYIIDNNPASHGTAPQFNASNGLQTIDTPPACSTAIRAGNCNNYDSANWSAVTQISAPGDAWAGAPACTSGPALTCDTGLPSLLAVENGQLWLYQGVFGQTFADPVLLGASGTTGWGGVTLIAPGDVGGTLSLWVRENSNGNLYSYTITPGTDGIPTLNPSGAATPVTATSGTLISNLSFPASSYPAVASPGPLDNSSDPGLYVEYTGGNDPAGSSCASGCLYFYPGQDPTPANAGLPLSTNWVFVGHLSNPVTELS